ncbi:HTH domain-containing protein [Demequina litorisediminis]|uniref:HTH domain-containing protein n=1 Tax=Demequina litorisediminis TaxID=1849022 RepID=UPI0024E12FCD|nr:HTH domain-containing protein [Demequina litorisediminis]
MATAQADPLAALAALPVRSHAAAIQYAIARSLGQPAPAAATTAPQAAPSLPAWHLCNDAQQARWRVLKRRAARSYHRSRPIRGLKASDRGHEAAVSRAVTLEDDLTRPATRAGWIEALEESAFIDSLDASQTSRKGRSKRDMVLEPARALAASERDRTGTTSPGHAYLARRLGVSGRTVTRYLRALEAAGFVMALSAGRSAGYGGSDEGALRVVYLLVVPRDPSKAAHAAVHRSPHFHTVHAVGCGEGCHPLLATRSR